MQNEFLGNQKFIISVKHIIFRSSELCVIQKYLLPKKLRVGMWDLGVCVDFFNKLISYLIE